MRELGLANPALDVEAVGFAPWEGRWLGVMVTPWSMNLALAPLDAAAWRPLAQGAKRRYRFPAGIYEFIGAGDAAHGDYQICSLFSPMDAFADQEGARLVARLARDALLDPANADDASGARAGGPARTAGEPGPLASLEAGLSSPLSKRELLHGLFGGGARGTRG